MTAPPRKVNYNFDRLSLDCHQWAFDAIALGRISSNHSALWLRLNGQRRRLSMDFRPSRCVFFQVLAIFKKRPQESNATPQHHFLPLAPLDFIGPVFGLPCSRRSSWKCSSPVDQLCCSKRSLGPFSSDRDLHFRCW